MFKRKRIKTYRLGLYGLSGTGKTCILTALAMGKRTNLASHSAVFIPSANQASKQQIDEAVELLEKGEVPRPTSLHQRPAHEYSFTVPEHQSFHVEIVDYSGELLHPDSGSGELAAKLRRHFSTMDGILVLAEAPGQAEQAQQIHQNLTKLNHAFAALKKDLQHKALLEVPVALLVSKWDRFSEIDYAHPDKEAEKLQAFLQGDFPHKTLADTLRNSVAADDFQAFAVSAFGPSEVVAVEDGQLERPKAIHPLHSFNLEEPFIWIARRRDDIDLHRYRHQAGKHLLKCGGLGRDLLRRFPEDSKQHKSVGGLLKHCRKIQGITIGSVAAGLIALLLLTELAVDMRRYYGHQAVIENATSDDQALNAAEAWFKHYQAAATDYRHLLTRCCFLSRQEAGEALARLQGVREERLWQPISRVDTLQAKAPLAQTYLDQYPNGKHAEEARKITVEADLEKLRQANTNALEEVVRAYNVLNQEDLNQIEETLAQLDTLVGTFKNLPPYPQAEIQSQQVEREAFGKTLYENREKLIELSEWIRFKEYAINLFQADRFLETAQALYKRRPVTLELKELKALFRTEAVKRIDAKARQFLLDNNPQQAKALLDQYFHPDFPPGLQTREGKTQLSELQQQVDLTRDRLAYEVIKEQRTLDAVTRYLNDAGLPKVMEKEVKAYQAYLESIRDDAMISNLKLELTRTEWHTWNYGENWVMIELNSEAHPIFHRQIGAVKKGDTSRNLGMSTPFSAASNHQITLKIKIEGKRAWDWKLFDNECNGSLTGLLGELARTPTGLKVPVYEQDDLNKAVATVYLKLHGYPQAPELPPFRD